METLRNLGIVSLSIPAWQMALFIGLISLSVVLRKTRCFLLTAYAFAFYWGYYLFVQDFIAAARGDTLAQSAYLGFGIVLVSFCLVSLFYEER
jgi:hypothetical protein